MFLTFSRIRRVMGLAIIACIAFFATRNFPVEALQEPVSSTLALTTVVWGAWCVGILTYAAVLAFFGRSELAWIGMLLLLWLVTVSVVAGFVSDRPGEVNVWQVFLSPLGSGLLLPLLPLVVDMVLHYVEARKRGED